MLHAGKQVLDEDDVVSLTDVLEARAGRRQLRHRLTLPADVQLERLRKAGTGRGVSGGGRNGNGNGRQRRQGREWEPASAATDCTG